MLEPMTLVLVCLAAFAGAIVGGIGGFGTGIVLTAVLAPLIGFKALVPVLSVAGVVINAGRFWMYRDNFDHYAARRVLLAGLPFLILGTWAYSRMDGRALGLWLGSFVILSIPLRRWLAARGTLLGPIALTTGGGVFGFVSGAASGTGVILVSLLLGAGLSGQAVLATDAMVTIVIDLSKTLLFGELGALNFSALTLGCLIGLSTLPASRLAAWCVERLGARVHVLAMDALILVGGASMLWQALRTETTF